MKNFNRYFNRILACVSLIAAMVTSYLWGSTGGGTSAELGMSSILLGIVFSFAAASCLSSLEKREKRIC